MGLWQEQKVTSWTEVAFHAEYQTIHCLRLMGVDAAWKFNIFFPPKAQFTESHSTSRENHEMGLTSVCCHDSAPAQNSQKNYYSVRGTPEDVLSLCCKNKPLKWRDRHKKHFVIPFFVPEAEPSLCALCVITRLKCPKKKKHKREKGKKAQ